MSELLTFEDGRRLARTFLSAIERQVSERLSFVGEPIAFDGGWIYLYDSALYVKTGDEDHALGGNAPIAVFAAGRVELLRTSESLETHMARLNSRAHDA